jgi:hypothetical protein
LDKVIMKKKVAVYYVSFCNFVNWDILLLKFMTSWLISFT